MPGTPPDVSVIIPYFNDQPRLTLLLHALDQQCGGLSLDVVIADDGSPEPPVVPVDVAVPCRVVRQDDRGFRAAAARNLGAAAATGTLLLFLDGDMLPSVGYVAALAASLREIDDGHGALVVGRRRHVDLGGAGLAATLAFLRAEPPATAEPPPAAPAPVEPPPVEPPTAAVGPAATGSIRLLDDPQWLINGYARTDNLRSATEEDFRLVISAVLGVDRRLWAATGGFDEDFVGYGGEDWDFGWRAWQSGARLAHVPEAVCWHDGPDAAGRGTELEVKNAECLRLARTVPLPSVRGTAMVLDQPAIVVQYLGFTTGTARDAAVVAGVTELLAGSDAAVWFPGLGPTSKELPPLLRDDPRVHAGQVPSRVLDRARYQVWMQRPVRLPMPLGRFCDLGEWDVPGLLRVRRTRSVRRGEPATPVAGSDVEDVVVQPIPEDLSLERWWGGW